MNRVAISIACLILLSGCATFKKDMLPEVSDAALPAEAAKNINIFEHWEVVSEKPIKEDLKQNFIKADQKFFDDAIAATNCCKISSQADQADVVIEGKIFFEDNSAAMGPAFFTGLTLFLIPSWVTINIHVTADVRSKSKQKSYELVDSATMVTWLPMVFAMPFRDGPIAIGNQVEKNVYKTLVVDIRNDGFL